MRILAMFVLVSLAALVAPAADLRTFEFDLPRVMRPLPMMFDPPPKPGSAHNWLIETAKPAVGRPGEAESAPESEPDTGPETRPPARPGPAARPSMHWAQRGFSAALVFTGALVYPTAGVGLEISIPVDAEISLIARAGVLGGVYYEGGCYDIGVRAFYDTAPRFTLYLTAGVRMLYGRILDFAGGHLKEPLHSAGFGGFFEGGLETGWRNVRFFAEVSLNGARSFRTEFQVMFFCGVNFGLRFYFG